MNNKIKSFFDDSAKFYETGYQPTRLRAKFEAIKHAH